MRLIMVVGGARIEAALGRIAAKNAALIIIGKCY
jgi:hypothetical protein